MEKLGTAPAGGETRTELGEHRERTGHFYSQESYSVTMKTVKKKLFCYGHHHHYDYNHHFMGKTLKQLCANA